MRNQMGQPAVGMYCSTGGVTDRAIPSPDLCRGAIAAMAYFAKVVRTLLLFILTPAFLLAQGIQDSIFSLRPVNVSSERNLQLLPGTNVVATDSLDRSLLRNGNAVTQLQTLPGINLKNYGPGRLATPSVRGSSASQTEVLWNGFSISNRTLGQTDLSLLPAFFLRKLSLDASGSASAPRNQSVGGAIQLQTGFRSQRPLLIEAQAGYGAFAQQDYGLGVEWGNARQRSQVRAIYQTARNNYPYENLFGESRRLSNARTTQQGLLAGHRRNWGNTMWQIDAWLQRADRKIPPTVVNDLSVARQRDEQLRLSTLLKTGPAERRWSFRLGFFDDILRYQDTLANIDSRSRVRRWETAMTYRQQLGEAHQLRISGDLAYARAESRSYRRNPERTTYGSTASLSGQHDRWSYRVWLRQSLQDGELLPLLPGIGAEYQASSNWTLRVQGQRYFRLPGFDDLFFIPGGNPALAPEKGWGLETGYAFRQKEKGWSLQWEGTLFQKHIDDWIIWLPGTAYWSPENVQRVRSRGFEQQVQMGKTLGGIRTDLRVNYTYTAAINQLAKFSGDATQGKQLIYVPRHQANARIAFSYDPLTLAYYHNWQSQRFTLPDNSEALPGQSVGDLELRVRFNTQWSAQGSIRNLWNIDYQSVLNRPMPGRHWMIQVFYTMQSSTF